jgi:LuxR family maltose regulon positive regulatory protein
LSNMQQEIEEELERDEEIVWQMIPLSYSFILHYTFRQEGASLVPQLLEAKERASRSESRYATHIVRQYLALAAVEAGRLYQAYEESLAALDLIKQLAGYALLKGYYEMALAQVYFQWNRLEEARDLLHTMVHDATAWQHLDLLAWGHAGLIQVELARGDRPAAALALHELEHLLQRERFAFYPGWLLALRAYWWLAQGQLREAVDWAAGVVFPNEAWERGSYDAFPAVIQVHFAEHRWTEALSLLERWRGHLDRPANTRITITYLAQYLVALHQTGKTEQAHVIAARLFALTEPEGYLRVYLDEGEPMKSALKMLLEAPPHADPTASAVAVSRPYVSRLLEAFEQEERKGTQVREASPVTTHKALPHPPPNAIQRELIEPLSRQEHQVLRLLVAGNTYAEMAQALIVSPNTIKTQVSSIYHKLGVSRRAEAIALTQRLQLL